jgi:DNA-binding response OmpR family regulator
MKVLVIEDDVGIGKVVRRGLETANFQVDLAPDGATGLKLALENPYNVIILDLMLPKLDGWHVCQELRSQRNRTPVLMLTARDAVEDRVRGLDLGADDYLPKPFDFTELLARVRALLRRDKIHRTRIIRVGDLEIDTAKRRVSRAGRMIGLSHREYELLESLAANEGRILTREAIQERVWMAENSFSNTVDVYIRMLRKKIDAGHPIKMIQTVHGVGYTLRLPETEAIS